MSSGLDTATRRRLRKAFGPEALKVIEAHEQGLRAHAETLLWHDAALQRNRSNLDTAFKNIAPLDVEVQRHKAELVAFGDVGGRVAGILFARGFCGRLRWLLRGK